MSIYDTLNKEQIAHDLALIVVENILEDIDNEYLEYFDFESMSFVNKVTKSVPINDSKQLQSSSFDNSSKLDGVLLYNKYSLSITLKSTFSFELSPCFILEIINNIWSIEYLRVTDNVLNII